MCQFTLKNGVIEASIQCLYGT